MRPGICRRAAMLLLDSGRKSLAQGALATAEATLERARALAAVDAERRAQIDEALLQVLSDAGKHERVFEVGDALLAALARVSARHFARPRSICSIARAAVAGSRFPEAFRHLEHARRLDTDGVLEARLDALAAHVAIEERRVGEAERLAQAALASAERLGQPEVACEALLVIGRLARRPRSRSRRSRVRPSSEPGRGAFSADLARPRVARAGHDRHVSGRLAATLAGGPRAGHRVRGTDHRGVGRRRARRAVQHALRAGPQPRSGESRAGGRPSFSAAGCRGHGPVVRRGDGRLQTGSRRH